ncbi:MAG TPA: permease-like cell division protein FtsX [Bacillota bacterium]|nr:permease-like cell division protein FtsX [Bacillota bacterium]
MKLRTLRRHFFEGLKNIFRNGWMTVASILAVTMTLLLVGVFLALVLNLNQIAKNIEDDVEIKVLIDRSADEVDIQTLGTQIDAIPNVESVRFASNDEELQSLVASMGESGEAWLLFEQENPLNHVYIVQSEKPKDVETIAMTVKELNYVQEVNYGQDYVDKLFTFNQYARYIGLALIIGLVLTAIFLISNTIKLTIMARSTEIGIMRLVGATNSFIRWPFLIEGMFLGAFGAVIPIIIVMFGYYYLDIYVSSKITFSFIDLLPFTPFAWQLAALILGIGVFIGMWGSVMSIRKFLKV